MLINVAWCQEFSGGTKFWNWVSHFRSSGLILYYSTKDPPATQHRREKERKRERRRKSKMRDKEVKQTKKSMDR